MTVIELDGIPGLPRKVYHLLQSVVIPLLSTPHEVTVSTAIGGHVVANFLWQCGWSREHPYMHRVGLQTIRVYQIYRIVLHIEIQIYRVFRTDRIGTQPASDPVCVISVAEVVKPRKIIPLLARIATGLELYLPSASSGDKGGASEWKILLIGDHPALFIQLQ